MSDITTKDKDFQPLSVRELLSTNQYFIPLYQRNYAWGNLEITQLLSDIRDKYKDGIESNYYIGTLVTDLRKDGGFEIIDGQQRHTTLTLINAVIAGVFPEANAPVQSNLRFEAREQASELIAKYFNDYQGTVKTMRDSFEQRSISRAVRDIATYLTKIDQKWKEERSATYSIEGLLKYFFDQVIIVRANVPPQTDINHYFEIMNNRGEQLEKHEVLKARLMAQLMGQEKKRDLFAIIWEACSQMNKPIQLNITDTTLRADIFGKDLRGLPLNFLEKYSVQLPETAGDKTNETDITGSKSPFLRDLLLDERIAKEPSGTGGQEGSFRSVIDFPNFLLQVFNLQRDVPLDDKKLLDAFGDKNNGKLPNAIEFIDQLLYYRTCFDRYIIKRPSDGDEYQRWKILSLESAGDNPAYKNTFQKNYEISMLQSMLHVSFPANNYKNWLKLSMAFFKENPGFEEDTYHQLLINYSKTYFKELQPFNFQQATNIGNYVFNYVDYLLWDLYWQKVKPTENNPFQDPLLKRIARCRTQFFNFRFTPNNSVEHVAPQHPIDGSESIPNVDNFGNLCLISRNTNSRLSNLGFKGKLEYFQSAERKGRMESLKQALIFSYDAWDENTVNDHAEEMISVLPVVRNQDS